MDGTPGYVTRLKARKMLQFRNYSRLEDLLNFYRENLMLFVPWRNEDIDILKVNLPKKFEENLLQINQKRGEYIKIDRENLDHCLEEAAEANNEFGPEIMDPISASEDKEARAENVLDDLLYDSARVGDEVQGLVHALSRIAFDNTVAPVAVAAINTTTTHCDGYAANDGYGKLRRSRIVEVDDLLKTVRSLNYRQFLLFNHVSAAILRDETFYVFVSGGAGVGKSHYTP